jgi:hypothetical protein
VAGRAGAGAGGRQQRGDLPKFDGNRPEYALVTDTHEQMIGVRDRRLIDAKHHLRKVPGLTDLAEAQRGRSLIAKQNRRRLIRASHKRRDNQAELKNDVVRLVDVLVALEGEVEVWSELPGAAQIGSVDGAAERQRAVRRVDLDDGWSGRVLGANGGRQRQGHSQDDVGGPIPRARQASTNHKDARTVTRFPRRMPENPPAHTVTLRKGGSVGYCCAPEAIWASCGVFSYNSPSWSEKTPHQSTDR